MSKVAKSTLSLMMIIMITKLFGFSRELILTYTYGTSLISDVYITSMSIPTILFAAIASAIGTTFIPLFLEIEKQEGKLKALDFTNNIINIVIIIGLFISILTFIFTEPVVKLFAINFNGTKLDLAIEFTKIMIFGVIFIGLSNIMTAWLQINEEFNIPGMIGCPLNVFIIIGIILSSKGNLKFMAIGTLIGMASQFIFQLPYAIKKGFKYRFYINIKDKNIKKMIYLILPVFIGVGVNQVNSIIDKSLASTLNEGAITVLNSANRLNGFVLGIFIMTIASIIYPMLSKLNSQDDRLEFIKSVTTSINSVILIMIPISTIAIIFSEPIVQIVFERGAFNSESTMMTSIALKCYSIGMLGFGLREILNKVFYSIKDTKTPMINGGLEVIFNIVLNLILIKYLGYSGLALATSISTIITVIIYFNSLKNKIKEFKIKKIIITIIKSLIACIIMTFICGISYKFIIDILGVGTIYNIIAFTIASLLGIVLYIILTLLMKVDEINYLAKILKNKINKI